MSLWVAMLKFESWIDAPIERVWEFHSSAEALRVLTPPNSRIEVLSDDVRVEEGALHEIRFRFAGFAIEWHARISNVRPPHRFVDTAEKGPFAYWEHVHEFVELEGRTLVRDSLDYRLPLGPLGVLADALFVRRELERTFAYRHEATKRALEG